MSAFGTAAERARVWCNLCRAEGKEFVVYPDDEDRDWVAVMQEHSFAEHAEHEAALAAGVPYVPVEVAP